MKEQQSVLTDSMKEMPGYSFSTHTAMFSTVHKKQNPISK